MTTPNVQLLADKTSELSAHITNLHFEHNPGLEKRYGAEGKRRCHEDTVFHLNFLVEAMALNLPDIYINYTLWAVAMLKSRNISDTDLAQNLNFVQQAIREVLGSKFASTTKIYIDAAIEKLKERPGDSVSHITDDNPLKKEVAAYLGYLLAGKRREATVMISDLLTQGVSIKDIYRDIFQVSQYEVGRLWECNKITVAHEHYCTAATQQIISGLYPFIYSAKRSGKTLVACSISGELHELGIRMVTDFFEMDGWDTYYLGANMPDNELQEALIEYRADILALSVSLPIHLSKVAALIKKIRSHRDLANIKIMVGGYSFLTNLDLWKKVDADAFAQNAEQAIAKANEMVNQ